MLVFDAFSVKVAIVSSISDISAFKVWARRNANVCFKHRSRSFLII
jgi:hypothetical protein